MWSEGEQGVLTLWVLLTALEQTNIAICCLGLSTAETGEKSQRGDKSPNVHVSVIVTE